MSMVKASQLQPYPAYKPSRIDWLGDIPAHWDVRRLKTVCRLAYGDTLTASMRNYGSVPVYGSNGQVGVHSEANTMSPCIVVGRKGSFGKVNYVEQPAFAIDTTYFVDERYSRNNLRWLFYILGWLRLDDVTRDSAIPGLGRDDAYGRLAPVPPLAEQAAIARYLDRADERIRRAIDAKRHLVELLTEQRQAVIHRAVTRGLDAGAPLKASGVEWLGDVPAHWDVRRLKYTASLNPSRTEVRATLNDYTPVVFLPMEKVGEDGCIDQSETRPAHEVWSGFTYFKRGDVLVAKITPCFENGKGAYLGSLRTNVGFGSTEFHVLRANDTANPQFLYRLTMTQDFRRQGADAMTGAAGQQRVPAAFVANYAIPLPPLTEQAAIVRHLDKATADIDAAIANAERQVELLGEYRARLLADVVLGRVDVRGAA